ncbi:MAG: hypothetical protein ACI840_001139, partial [Ulvibacter sp.]
FGLESYCSNLKKCNLRLDNVISGILIVDMKNFFAGFFKPSILFTIFPARAMLLLEV